jgi:hypothetical protein
MNNQASWGKNLKQLPVDVTRHIWMFTTEAYTIARPCSQCGHFIAAKADCIQHLIPLEMCTACSACKIAMTWAKRAVLSLTLRALIHVGRNPRFACLRTPLIALANTFSILSLMAIFIVFPMWLCRSSLPFIVSEIEVEGFQGLEARN